MEKGLSFLEFNYMLLQGYDFCELYNKYGCRAQIAGADQWGNITSGTELGRRRHNVELFGFTSPIITDSSGKQIGKSEGNAVWINEDKLPAYDYYQYFRNIGGRDYPRTADGSLDLESPYCLDLDLLNQHFDQLERGEEILVPSFSFSRHMRDTSQVRPLRAGKDEAIIFEGIHALNDLITDRHPHAQRLYISARSGVAHQDDVLVKSTWTRLLRRCVRDYNYRGTDAVETLGLWANVRLGEKLHISPFKDKADFQFDTAHPYEPALFNATATTLFSSVPEGIERFEELRAVLPALQLFGHIDESLIAPDALVREFLGGGIYEY